MTTRCLPAGWLGPGRWRGLPLLVVLVLVWGLGGSMRAASAAPPERAIALVRAELPERLCPGERRRVPVVVRNVGASAWDPAQADRVAYHWLDAAGAVVERDGERSELPQVVPPGGEVALEARLRAPTTAGRYRLQWAMVRERVGWAEAEGSVEIEVSGAEPALAWSRVTGGVPSELFAGEPARVPLTVRNEGCAAWSPAQRDRVAYRWLDRDGRVVVAEGERSPLPETPPGSTASLSASVRAPARPGAYALQWRVVREGLAWLPDVDAPIPVEVGSSPWAWSLWPVEPLGPLSAGERRDVDVWLVHEGQDEWSSEQGDALSYRWFDRAGQLVAEGARVQLPSPWLPGDAERVTVPVVAPSEAGRYRLAFEPVREGVRWFGPASSPGADPWIEVAPPALAWEVLAVAAPGARWVERTDTLRVVLRNTGTETWSEPHGDRLSYRWYDEDGITMLGDGLRTSMPHEVAPGQTVELDARVRGPAQPGRFVLELEMVREHVRWYGPPGAGQPRVRLRAERLSSYWVVLVGLAGLGAAWALRRASAAGSRWWWAWRCGPALWAGAATVTLAYGFVDLTGAEPWSGVELSLWGPGALLSLVLLPLPPRVQAWAGALAVLVLTLLVLADLAYLHFFGSIVPLSALLAAHHLGDAEATVSSLLRPEYGWLMALPGLGVVVAASWPGRARTTRPVRARRGGLAVALGLGLASAPLVTTMSRAFEAGLDQQVFSEQDNVGRLGLFGAHLFQLIRQLETWLGPDELTPAQRETLAATLEQQQQRRAAARERAPGFGAAQGYDVIIVQAEALQQWVIGARVEGQAITPFLDAATEDALYFDQVFDQTAQGRTSDAEYLVLGSGHPTDRGALAFLHEDDPFYTLAHVLADAGYPTTSAHPYKRGFWNRARLHPRYGFARSLFRRELGPGPSIGWGLSDEAFFERMLPEIVAAPRPSMWFLVTLSLHHPYEHFPEALVRLDLGSLHGTAVGNYLHAMNHLDGALASLVDALRRDGRGAHTLLVVYGDHVTGLGEPPPVLALAGRATWDPSLHAELHRVPVFAWVGVDPPASLRGRRSSVGGHVDIGPTVLHLLGIDDPRPAAFGRTLLDPSPGMAALSNGGAASSERLFVAGGEGIPRGGGCFERPLGHSVPRAECDELAARSAAELTAARQVLDHDLQRGGL